MVPWLVLVADIIGVFGAYLIGVHKLGFNALAYLRRTWDFVQALDIIPGLTKAAVIGFPIAPQRPSQMEVRSL